PHMVQNDVHEWSARRPDVARGHDDRIHRAWNGAPSMAHGHGGRQQVFAGPGLRGPDLKGKYSAEHLVHDESKSVDVRFLRHGTAPDLLWRQTLQRRLFTHEIRELQLVPQAAQLHIEELELSVVAQHHI